MIGEFPEEAEASLEAAYGRNIIAEYWREEITLRRVRVLLQGLPTDSAFHRAYTGHGWRDSEYLLWHIANNLIAYRNEYATAHEAKPGEPAFLPAPGQEDEETPKITAADARRAVLEAIARGNGG